MHTFMLCSFACAYVYAYTKHFAQAHTRAHHGIVVICKCTCNEYTYINMYMHAHTFMISAVRGEFANKNIARDCTNRQHGRTGEEDGRGGEKEKESQHEIETKRNVVGVLL